MLRPTGLKSTPKPSSDTKVPGPHSLSVARRTVLGTCCVVRQPLSLQPPCRPVSSPSQARLRAGPTELAEEQVAHALQRPLRA